VGKHSPLAIHSREYDNCRAQRWRAGIPEACLPCSTEACSCFSTSSGTSATTRELHALDLAGSTGSTGIFASSEALGACYRDDRHRSRLPV
jgi:hypothetical protein